MNLAAARHTWLVTLPIALGASAYVWFVFLPGKRAIAELDAEMQTKQMFAANVHQTAAAIRRLEHLTHQTQAYNNDHRLPAATSGQFARLYGRIAQTAREAGVRTTRFAPEPPAAYEQFQKVSLRLGCVGTFAQVSRLLGGLERLPQPIWVDSISMQPEAEDGEHVRCEFMLGVFVDNFADSD